MLSGSNVSILMSLSIINDLLVNAQTQQFLLCCPNPVDNRPQVNFLQTKDLADLITHNSFKYGCTSVDFQLPTEKTYEC